mgnify:CR=1 FL=1
MKFAYLSSLAIGCSALLMGLGSSHANATPGYANSVSPLETGIAKDTVSWLSLLEIDNTQKEWLIKDWMHSPFEEQKAFIIDAASTKPKEIILKPGKFAPLWFATINHIGTEKDYSLVHMNALLVDDNKKINIFVGNMVLKTNDLDKMIKIFRSGWTIKAFNNPNWIIHDLNSPEQIDKFLVSASTGDFTPVKLSNYYSQSKDYQHYILLQAPALKNIYDVYSLDLLLEDKNIPGKYARYNRECIVPVEILSQRTNGVIVAGEMLVANLQSNTIETVKYYTGSNGIKIMRSKINDQHKAFTSYQEDKKHPEPVSKKDFKQPPVEPPPVNKVIEKTVTADDVQKMLIDQQSSREGIHGLNTGQKQ